MPALRPALRPVLRTAAALLFAAGAALAAPASAQVASTLDFDNVAINASGYNVGPYSGRAGYTFENWGVMASTEPLGVGVNASSASQFAYGFATVDNFIYREDETRFALRSAFLSFRTFDADASPASVTVRGYRGADEVFTRVLELTNGAQRFTFNWRNLDEVAFETGALSDTRSAVLAVDDLGLTAVPEPATVVLLGLGGIAVLGVGAARRRV